MSGTGLGGGVNAPTSEEARAEFRLGDTLRDTSLLGIPLALRAAFGIAGAALVGRGLGPIGYGHHSLALSLSDLLVQLADLGLGQTAIRYASRAFSRGQTEIAEAVLDRAWRWRVMLLCGIGGLLALMAEPLARRVLGVPGLIPILWIGLLSGALTGLAAVPLLRLQAEGRFAAFSGVSVLQVALTFVAVLGVAVSQDWSLLRVSVAGMLASALSLAISLAFLPRSAVRGAKGRHWRLRPREGQLTGVWRAGDDGTVRLDGAAPGEFALYLSLGALIWQVLGRLDLWCVGAFMGGAEAGLYAAALRLSLPLSLTLSALGTALWPRCAVPTTSGQALSLLRRIAPLSAVLSLGALAYAVIVPLAVVRLFGLEYSSGAPVARLLCARYGISMLTYPLTWVGYSLGFVKRYWMIGVLQLTVAATMMVLLLPVWGTIAAAWSWIVVEVLGGLALVWLFLRHLSQGIA